MLIAKRDLYNGLIVDTKSIPSLVSDFKTSLQNLLQKDLVSSALSHQGLKLSSNNIYFSPRKKHIEIYL